MKIQLIRHATIVLDIKGKRILLDPMLGEKGSMPAVPGVANTADNPLVGLPFAASSLTKVDAVMISHTHRDHFDDTAIQLIPKDMQMFCQPGDCEKIGDAGFNRVQTIETSLLWEGINIHRTGGQHGTGSIGQKMGPVSGFVLEAENEPSLYITGDTIYCSEVQSAIEKYKPRIIICFAGAASFSQGDPITMSKEDIKQVGEAAPLSKLIIVHLEAWNHCFLSRKVLRNFIQEEMQPEQVYIPEDGDCLDFQAEL